MGCILCVFSSTIDLLRLAALTRARFSIVVVLCVAGVLLQPEILGQTANAHLARGLRAPAAAGDRLKMVVVLSRHGVRSPTWTEEKLNRYSVKPWPQWPVAPGYLTQHGFDLLERFGSYDRAALAQAGLFVAQGCGDAAATTIWADTDQRTIESGRALAKGLFPECAPEVHSLAEGEKDPLFHPDTVSAKAEKADTAFSVLAKRAARQPVNAELLTEMQRVLSGCDPHVECKPAHAPEERLLDAPFGVHWGPGDPMVNPQGPLPQASSFAEDFLLEYADGMPLESVGWGRLNEAQVRRFLDLHTANFDLMHRTPSLAKANGSNMLWHIVKTLQQGAEGKPVEGAIGKTGDKLVVLVGHDTNLASVAALLGLHWELDGRRDDTPPGMEMAFELWQTHEGKYVVRLSVTTQTLKQMRKVQNLSLEAPPAREIVRMSNCSARKDGCELEEFHRIVETAIDPHQVVRSGLISSGK
jgi:4-phytase/acid phosphatase